MLGCVNVNGEAVTEAMGTLVALTSGRENNSGIDGVVRLSESGIGSIMEARAWMPKYCVLDNIVKCLSVIRSDRAGSSPPGDGRPGIIGTEEGTTVR